MQCSFLLIDLRSKSPFRGGKPRPMCTAFFLDHVNWKKGGRLNMFPAPHTVQQYIISSTGCDKTFSPPTAVCVNIHILLHTSHKLSRTFLKYTVNSVLNPQFQMRCYGYCTFSLCFGLSLLLIYRDDTFRILLYILGFTEIKHRLRTNLQLV